MEAQRSWREFSCVFICGYSISSDIILFNCKEKNAQKQVAIVCGIGIILLIPVLIFDIQLPYHRNHSTGYFEIVTPSQGSALILIASFAASILLSFLVSKIIEVLKKHRKK